MVSSSNTAHTEIRQLTREELPDSIALSEFAFQFEMSPEHKEEQVRLGDPKQIWGYWIDGKLASKLSILDHAVWIHGRTFAMGGIGGVATWPEYRRQGMVRQLLRSSLQVMREKGQSVSYLHPFSFPFYRRHGWETFTEYRKYKIDANKLAGVFPAGEGHVERVAAGAGILNPVYEAFAKSYNGMLQRSEPYWTEQYAKHKKGMIALYRNALGEARGYVCYRVRDKVCTVHELVWLDEEARGGLWKFLADHDSMLDNVHVQAPADDQLPFLLPDPRIEQATVPYFMARIVDVSAFLGQYPFTAAPEQEAVFVLRIQDEYADWNEGRFRVVIDASGQAAVRVLSQEEPTASEALSCTIATLTALLMGYQSASFLHAIGRISGSAEAVSKLAARIPAATTYLTDFF